MADRGVSLSWHTVEDVTVIRVQTSVSASALDKEAAAEKLKDLAEQSSGKVVLDMSQIEMIDSRILAAIVSISRDLGTQSGQLRICRVTPLVMEMLDAFGLSKVLKIDDTEKGSVTALRNFSKNGESAPL